MNLDRPKDKVMYDQNNLDLLLVNEALGDHALKKNDGAKAPNCAYATLFSTTCLHEK